MRPVITGRVARPACSSGGRKITNLHIHTENDVLFPAVMRLEARLPDELSP